MRTVSHYTCFFYIDLGKKDLVKIYNNACWAGLQSKNNYYYESPTEYNSYNEVIRVNYKKSIDYIYIDQYRTSINSLVNTKRLINIINKITPCKIVTVNKKSYIKYKLINKSHYHSNLVLLNYLRMIWYKPNLFNYEQFYKDISIKDLKGEDPLHFLMRVTKENVLELPKNSYADYMNHSLIIDNIIPKTSELLFNYNGDTMRNFLLMRL